MKTSFFESYLWVWAFLFQIPMGAIFILFIHDLTGGAWGESARASFVKMIRTFWFFPITFIPLIFGLEHLYPWIHDSKEIWRAGFYTPLWFSIRAIVYFILLAGILKSIRSTDRNKYKSAFGLCLYVLIMSLVSADWLMVREPEWHSTIYGLIWIMSSTIVAYALFLILRPRLLSEVNRDHASMFLIFITMWCYLAFMQYLIVWSGNLPKEVIYYIVRLRNGWEWPMLLITFGTFFIPFFLLLNKSIKWNGTRLAQISVLVLICRYLDMAWVILPPTRNHFSLGWFDLIIPLVLITTWFQLFRKAREA